MELESYHGYTDKDYKPVNTTDQCHNLIQPYLQKSKDFSYEMFHTDFAIQIDRCFLGNETYELGKNEDITITHK